MTRTDVDTLGYKGISYMCAQHIVATSERRCPVSMCEEKSKCHKPEKPECCTPEQIEECHGEKPCPEGKKPGDCSEETIQKCLGDKPHKCC
jgi:hypothetical protein